jgi:hypothetical protein
VRQLELEPDQLFGHRDARDRDLEDLRRGRVAVIRDRRSAPDGVDGGSRREADVITGSR